MARASLSDELAKDYKSFLIQRGLRVWPKDSPEAMVIREALKQDRRTGPSSEGKVTGCLTCLSDLSGFVAQADPEPAANAMLCAVNQAAYLLRRLIESQTRAFLLEGGFTEQMYASRVHARKAALEGLGNTDSSPACPLCGRPMRQRIAGQGRHAGSPFWGCSGFPECRGIRGIDGAV